MAAAKDGVGARRTWSLDERQRIVDEALAPDASVAAVARRHGLNANLVFKWIRRARGGSTGDARQRRGFDGLAADVAQVLRADPYSGVAFVFRSKRGDYVKILAWDGSGLCLFAKRLEKGKFVWPPIVEGALQLTAAQLALLIDCAC
jgi:transposase-like protein